MSQILSGDTREEILERIHTKLTNEATRVRAGEVPIDKFQIAKVGDLLFDVGVLDIARKELCDGNRFCLIDFISLQNVGCLWQLFFAVYCMRLKFFFI